MTYFDRLLQIQRAADSLETPRPTYARVFKFNPYHDDHGRFTTADNTAEGAAVALPKGGLTAYAAKYDDPTITTEDVYKQLGYVARQEITERMEMVNHLEPSDHQFKDKNGNWLPERAALHQLVVGHILTKEAIAAARPAPGEKPTAILLGGRPGSGKSAFTNGTINEFDTKKFLKLDSDEIKAMLKPPYMGWNAPAVHEEATYVFDTIDKIARGLGLNVIYDTTMRTYGNAEARVQALKQQGYRVEGHYMFLPRQTAALRAAQRYLSVPDHHGRLVPPDYVLSNKQNDANFDKLKDQFDRWTIYDNQGAQSPRLVGRSGK